jgi:hypothetical protein
MQILPGANARWALRRYPDHSKWRCRGDRPRDDKTAMAFYGRHGCIGPPPDERVVLMPIETMRSVNRK